MSAGSASRVVVAVFGSSTARPGDPVYERSHRLGRALAERGAVVMSGGYGGVMEAVSRGARDAGGHVVGVTVELFERRGPVNPWVVERVHAPDLFERLRHLVERAQAFVVAGGSVGTLTELFLVWTLAVASPTPRAPVVLLGDHWRGWLDVHRSPEFIPEALFEHVVVAATPEEAADRALGVAKA
jgi:hypothetical protein